MSVFEVNFDGLVGPTHHYAGLAFGNIASMKNKEQISSPRNAALQGLEKMKLLADLGLKQAVLPPQLRPDIHILRKLGFFGSDARVLEQASEVTPELFSACCTSSSMWAANAATVTPSKDSEDNRVHFTPANLNTHFHRSIETAHTSKVLQAIFSNEKYFKHHESVPFFSDEGAANHTRLASKHGDQGLHIFVYGEKKSVTKFPARQSREASEIIARHHLIPSERAIFIEQNPKLIDLGVFHADVISTGNENLFLYHEEAFTEAPLLFEILHRKLPNFCEIKIKSEALDVEKAIASYLFNSQIVTIGPHEMALIAPVECREMKEAKAVLDAIVNDNSNPIKSVHYVDVRQSMNNGGGPACLRLRVLLNEQELSSMNQKVLLNEILYNQLKEWINKHYREELRQSDLKDPQLLKETTVALDELSNLLGI